MGDIEPGTLWTILLSAASAVVLLANAADKVMAIIKASKAPNAAQNARLDALEEWKEKKHFPFLMVQCLRLLTSTVRNSDSIPGQGTKISHASWPN